MDFRSIIEICLIFSTILVSSPLVNAAHERFGTSKCDHEQLAQAVAKAAKCGDNFALEYTKTMLGAYKTDLNGTFDLVTACRTHNKLTEKGKHCLLDFTKTCFPTYIPKWLDRVFSAVELNCACTFQDPHNFCLVNVPMLSELVYEIARYYPNGNMLSLIAFDKSCEIQEKFEAIATQNGPCFQEKWAPLANQIVGFITGHSIPYLLRNANFRMLPMTLQPWSQMTYGTWPPMSQRPWPTMTYGPWPPVTQRPWPTMTYGPWPPVTQRPWPTMTYGPWPTMTYGPWPPGTQRPWPPMTYGPWPPMTHRPWPPMTHRPWPPVTHRPWPPVTYRPITNLTGVSPCATMRASLNECFSENTCFSTREMILLRDLIATGYQRGMEIFFIIVKEFGSLENLFAAIENTTLKWHNFEFPVELGIDMSNPITMKILKVVNHIIEDFEKGCRNNKGISRMDLINGSLSDSFTQASVTPTMMPTNRNDTKMTTQNENGRTGMNQPQKEETTNGTNATTETSGCDPTFRQTFSIMIVLLIACFV